MPSVKVRQGLYWSDRTKTWHYEFRFRGHKRNGDTGISSSRDLATRWLRRFKEDLAAEEVGLEIPTSSSSLREILGAWAKAETDILTAKHIQDRQDLIQLHFAAMLPHPIGMLTTERLDEIRSAYLKGAWRGKGWGRKTPSRPRTEGGWNRVLRQLRALLRWGIERNLLKKIPFTAKPVRAQEISKPVVWPEHVPVFLGHLDGLAPQDVRTAVRLMMQLGLREDEALNARWEWFVSRLRIYRPEETKDRQVREIALPPGLLPYLREHHGKAARGLVLPQEPHGPPHTAAYTYRAIQRAGLAMGIQGLTPHRLRATFATAHWEAGTTLSQIMAMMGHSDASTTMGYIVQRPKDQAQAQTKVARLMGFTSSPPQVPEKSIKKSKKLTPKASTKASRSAS